MKDVQAWSRGGRAFGHGSLRWCFGWTQATARMLKQEIPAPCLSSKRADPPNQFCIWSVLKPWETSCLYAQCQVL